MILNERQLIDSRRRAIILNEFALRKLVDCLFETVDAWKNEATVWRDKYYATETYVKGRRS